MSKLLGYASSILWICSLVLQAICAPWMFGDPATREGLVIAAVHINERLWPSEPRGTSELLAPAAAVITLLAAALTCTHSWLMAASGDEGLRDSAYFLTIRYMLGLTVLLGLFHHPMVDKALSLSLLLLLNTFLWVFRVILFAPEEAAP